jgi:hypothetical protein
VKKRDRKLLSQCKQNVQARLAPKNWDEQPEPMFKPANRVYEMAERTKGIAYGGIGAMATLPLLRSGASPRQHRGCAGQALVDQLHRQQRPG